MQTAKVFNPLTAPIGGTSLIEASAGTGKTWNIAALFLRLVVVENLAVDKILVVTFTKAAAAELKTRLRGRLDEALAVLNQLDDEYAQTVLQDAVTAPAAAPITEQGKLFAHDVTTTPTATIEPFLAQLLLLALARKQETASRLRLRLQAAINQFDRAGIFTIHAFCQRLLREYAFLCQLPFEVDLDGDTTLAQQRLAGDFWRQTVLPNPHLAALCIDNKLSPNRALKEIEPWLARTDLNFVLSQSEATLDDVEAQLRLLAQHLQQTLPQIEQQFWRLHGTVLDGNVYRKSSFQKMFAQLKQFCAKANTTPIPQQDLMLDKVKMLDASFLQKKCKKNQPFNAQDAVVFEPLLRLAALFEQQQYAKQALLEQLYLQLYHYLLPHWQAEKNRLQQLGVNDLLMDVATALKHPQRGPALAQRIVEQMWQVALIDEFQDTDPLQYGIFNTIFRQQNKPLFLVGDPKQAIYRFRGADIHAYLRAKNDADEHYTLDTNHRTHARLVASINALFMNKDAPFVLPEIDYFDVAAKRPVSALHPNPYPLQMQWLMQDDEEILTKAVAEQRAAAYCALDIAHHLAATGDEAYRYQDEPLQAKHFAVLVRSHHEGTLIQKSLRQHNILSVMLSQDSVFQSPQAKAILDLLQWWLNPQQHALMRTVLCGPLFQLGSHDIWLLNQPAQQQQLIAWLDDAQQARQVWQQRGIYAAWQMFDQQHGISRRLLQYNDKRGLTNVQQVFDLLAQQANEHFGAEALWQWLNDAINSDKQHDSAKLRLESDEGLVKIVTMHSAKGLEYPIVYCPFVWNNRNFATNNFNLIHDPAGDRIVSASCLDEHAQQQLLQDELSENLRLLYVAFTRAEEKLVLSTCLNADAMAGKTNQLNGLNYLITPPRDASIEAVAAVWQQQPSSDKKLSPAQNLDLIANNHEWLQQMWQQWASARQLAFLWRGQAPAHQGRLSHTQPQQHFQAATAPLRHYRLQQYTSFSGISRQLTHIAGDEMTPEIDSAELQDAVTHPLTATAPPDADTNIADDEFNLFAFQRGTEAGLCMHALLEHTDFARPASTQYPQHQALLTQYQIAPEWHPALQNMLDATRLAWLDDGINLAQLQTHQYLAEMGFVVRVDAFGATALQHWLQHTHIAPRIKQAAKQLQFKEVVGFLNGYIDLTCIAANNRVYVIDYKSNHLGTQPAHYQDAQLDAAMIEHRYYVQAIIYAIAVERYLRTRQIEVDGIHIRYMFLRGLKAQSGQGIWRWDITAAQLEKLTTMLLRDNISAV